MKLTGPQIVSFCAGYHGLEDVDLDNDRGQRAAEAYSELLTRAQGYQVRQKALHKDRQRIIKDQAVVDRKGNFQYGESPTGKPGDRPVQFKDEKRAEAALEAWEKKADAFDKALIEVEVDPIPDDFFAKPEPITVKQSVRTAFLPLMLSQQVKLDTAPKKRAK